ncbi:MAG: low-specificity L-threonine aldolase [Dehalococcoidia bacterium]
MDGLSKEGSGAMKVIDLRSDTVTLPTPEMREAMKNAELGDDVFGEDPTVIKLEAMAAEKLGKEAALLVSSGTQGNLVSILTHCQRGDEVVLGDLCHTYRYEAGAVSAFGGVHVYTVPSDARGRLDPAAVEQAIRPDNVHFPRTGLICMENTHNLCGGATLGPEDMAPVAQVAARHGLPMHLDGARIFNASVALGMEAKDLAEPFSSLSFCLSKGLSCPVGSIVCGSEEFIRNARRVRKALGGGMRQAGIIAAAGIVALETMIDRLAEDHAMARLLAEGLAEVPGIRVDLERVQTNMVMVQVEKEVQNGVVAALAERNVKVLDRGGGRLRLVTHRGIEDGDIGQAIEAFGEVMK